MTPYTLRKKAEEFGISYQSAVQMRIRYLVAQYAIGFDWIDDYKAPMPDVMPMDCLDEIDKLKKSLIRDSRTSITDEMIEQARNVRVDEILEFRHGKCRCIDPDHVDKNASAYYGTRTNRLVCPVCDKKWDSIAVQMHFTGQNFQEAVKTLCNQ